MRTKARATPRVAPCCVGRAGPWWAGDIPPRRRASRHPTTRQIRSSLTLPELLTISAAFPGLATMQSSGSPRTPSLSRSVSSGASTTRLRTEQRPRWPSSACWPPCLWSPSLPASRSFAWSPSPASHGASESLLTGIASSSHALRRTWTRVSRPWYDHAPSHCPCRSWNVWRTTRRALQVSTLLGAVVLKTRRAPRSSRSKQRPSSTLATPISLTQSCRRRCSNQPHQHQGRAPAAPTSQQAHPQTRNLPHSQCYNTASRHRSQSQRQSCTQRTARRQMLQCRHLLALLAAVLQP
mmetsp:Transcript_57907/g.148969  ORF Transcript_57907/g.148969 Transcript_57907/m.148969 type:complete len:295 (+) Transcript_57907:1031-1915(+)